MVTQCFEKMEFYQSVCDIAKEKTFRRCFNELLQTGNRQGIIRTIMKFPQVLDFEITESYVNKDDARARVIFEKSRLIKNIDRTKIDSLTKALCAANSYSNIFLKILMERTRSWFDRGEFVRCIKDCEYMIALSTNLSDSAENILYYLECKIECFLLKSKCLKQLGSTEKVKSCLNDGMREVDNLVKLKSSSGIVSNDEKLEILKPFLERLKEKKYNDKQCNAINNVSSELPLVPNIDGKVHDKLINCSDAVAVKYNSVKGRHLVASRNIKIGSILIVDQPFSFSTDKEALDKNCLHCHVSLNLDESIKVPCINCQSVSFCSEYCRSEAWEKYHKYECTIFNCFYDIKTQQRSYLLLSYRTTVAMVMENINAENRLNAKFMEYHKTQGDEVKKLKIKLDDEYDSLDYRTVYSLETNFAHIDRECNLEQAIQGIFLAKCLKFVLKKIKPSILIDTEELTILATGMLYHLQAINCNAYEIVENIWNEESKVWEPRNVGGALYTTVSLINHSCYANVIRHSYPRGTVVVRALRFIEKGSEILDCYGPHFLRDEKTSRYNYLLKKYAFRCTCEACLQNWQLPLADAMYKCPNCSEAIAASTMHCSKCYIKINRKKIEKQLQASIKKRIEAISKMYEGNHKTALPILLEHANFIEKILTSPNLEAIKTQQAIVQCFNSIGCVSK